MKLRSKIYLFSVGILFVILLFMNVAIYFLYVEFSMDKQEDTLSNQAKLILDNVSIQELKGSGGNVLEPYRIDDGMVRFVNKQGKVVHAVIDEGDLKDIPPQMVDDEDTSQVTADDQKALVARYPVSPDDDDDDAVGTLELAVTLEPITENVSLLLSILVIASLAALILSLLGGILLSNLVLRPVTELSGTMKDIEESGKFQRIESAHRSRDELYELEQTFNRMIDRLEMNFEKQKQFVSDASHELKTPLTAIESYANLLKRWGSEDPEVRKEAVDSIRSEGHRMRMLIEQLLDLASSESKGTENSSKKIKLVPFCEKVARDFEKMYQRDVRVEAKHHEEEIEWDPQKLRQVLSILLDNALKYSEKPVEILIDKEDGHTTMTVRDKGIGIPKRDRERIFERFYRIDPSRQRKTGGTGLGLPIAKALVEQYGGKISVDSEEGKGTSMTVVLNSSFS